MEKIFLSLKRKMNGMIRMLFFNGFILTMLAVLILWKPYLLNVFVALMVLSVAWVFFYMGYKVWAFKNDIKKHLKI